MTTICLAIIARNEEQSLLPACARCFPRSALRKRRRRCISTLWSLPMIARIGPPKSRDSFPRVRLLTSSGGKVEAQRRVANTTPFVIFSDADIVVTENTVASVCRAMLDDPQLQVAYPRKQPLAPMRTTLLANALHCYNRVNGFQQPRRYFNGKFFAIRDWRVPTLEELRPRLALLPQDRFYDFHSGMRVDDIWLSREVLRRYGADAIREVQDGEIRYRPPETFKGMYRTYHRHADGNRTVESDISRDRIRSPAARV